MKLEAFIIAGTRKEYEKALKTIGGNPVSYPRLDRIEKLRGHTAPTVLLYGTWADKEQSRVLSARVDHDLNILPKPFDVWLEEQK